MRSDLIELGKAIFFSLVTIGFALFIVGFLIAFGFMAGQTTCHTKLH